MGNKQHYGSIDGQAHQRVLLGVLTYDANLLIIRSAGGKAHTHEDPRRSE